MKRGCQRGECAVPGQSADIREERQGQRQQYVTERNASQVQGRKEKILAHFRGSSEHAAERRGGLLWKLGGKDAVASTTGG